MRMIVCTGSERPITQVLFNRDDDLLFAASVDAVITLWHPETGERLGTYNGHRGAVNAIAIDFQSNNLLSGSGDGSMVLWQVSSGEKLHTFEPNKNRVTTVDFSCGDKFFLGSTPQQLGNDSAIHIYQNPCLKNNDIIDEKTDDDSYQISAIQVSNHLKIKNFKVSKAMWSPLNDRIFGSCSDGSIRIFDVEKETEIDNITFDPNFSKKQKTNADIDANITDMRYCNGQTCLIATSRNTEARMFDLRTWDCVKTYSTDRGLNTVAIHPSKNVNGIFIGGGKSAQEAALKRGRGDYEVVLEHIIYEERMGLIDPECFSPLNSMTFNSDGSLLVLAYEEGTVRIFKMDANFDEKWKKIEERFISENIDDEDDEEED